MRGHRRRWPLNVAYRSHRSPIQFLQRLRSREGNQRSTASILSDRTVRTPIAPKLSIESQTLDTIIVRVRSCGTAPYDVGATTRDDFHEWTTRHDRSALRGHRDKGKTGESR